MKWLRWLEQSNSVILEFDHIAQDQLEIFEEQVSEVEKFYQFSSVEEIASRTNQKKRQGLAAITFNNPRKSVILRALPVLTGKKIPFTLFLRADCIGLNKLPPEEELGFYIKKYPDKFLLNEIEKVKQDLPFAPEKVDEFLRSLRSGIGPLPLELIDPTLFFCTWGKLKEIPKDLVEWGVSLYLSPSKSPSLGDEILFMRQQLGFSPRVARVAAPGQEAAWNAGELKKLNLAGCVTGKDGAVTRESHWWDLPYWRFST